MRQGIGWVLAWMLCVSSAPVYSQTDWDEVRLEPIQVDGNVYMLGGPGGNIGVVIGVDGILMIDDKFTPLSKEIQSVLDSLGHDKPTYLLNTHWHGDHTGSNEVFANDASIIAHDNVRKRLSMRQELTRMTFEARPKEALPVITFQESLFIYFNDETLHMVHFPNAHTDGDAVIFFSEANVVHMGDLMFSGLFPFVDVETGGNVERLMDALDLIIARVPDDVKLIPGHGPLSNKDDLLSYRSMIGETTEIIRERMKRGMSSDQIKAENPFVDYSEWSWSFINEERWADAIYRSLDFNGTGGAQ